MNIYRNRGSLKEQREMENARAEVEKQAAYIDYIAMMSDIDLPEDTIEEDSNE